MRKICKFITIIFVFIFCGIVVLVNYGCDSSRYSGIDSLPKYYRNYISKKMDRLENIRENNSINSEFIFLTDLHWESNTKKSPLLVKTIAENLGINKVVLGGDYTASDYENTEDALSVMKECVNSFEINGTCNAILGNHETNRAMGQYTSIPSSECIYAISGGKRECAYFDELDDENKTAFFYLNTNNFAYGNEQYNWLKERLISLGKDYTAFIFMHIYFNYMPSGQPLTYENQGKLLNDLLNDNNVECLIGGIFSGHSHRDYLGYNEKGLPFIVTTSDTIFAYSTWDGAVKREKRTITEQAFDVVQVDQKNRKVFLTRIGAGYNREYIY